MKIGFDLDKILIDFPPLVPDRLIDRLYRKRANGELAYRIPSKAEQLLRRASHHPFLRPGIDENISFIKNLPRENNKLFLISSRFGFLENRTKNLIKTYKFDEIFDQMFFNYSNKQPHEFKDEILKKLHLDIYIDDDFHLLKYVAKHNKDTVFYWFSGGSERRKITRNIYAVSRLSDIFQSPNL